VVEYAILGPQQILTDQNKLKSFSYEEENFGTKRDFGFYWAWCIKPMIFDGKLVDSSTVLRDTEAGK
jgi:hypothetical protein